MSEAAFAAFRVAQSLDRFPRHCLMAGDDQLGYAVAVGHGEGLVGQVGQYHAEFATVVSVDGAGTVEQGNAVFQGQPRAGPHLGLIACGQGDVEPRGH